MTQNFWFGSMVVIPSVMLPKAGNRSRSLTL